MLVGVVQELTCYAVKSMGGHRVTSIQVDGRGFVGDRLWAAYTEDGGLGSGKTTQRFRRVDGLLDVIARPTDGAPVLVLPGGEEVRAGTPGADEALTRLLGRQIRLRPEGAVRHHDESGVHLLTTASLQALSAHVGAPVDARRFRANLLVDTRTGGPEELGPGQRVAVGPEVVLRLGAGMTRCVMVGLPQPGLDRDPRILKAVAAHHGMEMGLTAEVDRPGAIREGDPVRLLDHCHPLEPGPDQAPAAGPRTDP